MVVWAIDGADCNIALRMLAPDGAKRPRLEECGSKGDPMDNENAGIRRLMVFMAPTVALVLQQAQYLRVWRGREQNAGLRCGLCDHGRFASSAVTSNRFHDSRTTNNQ